MQYSGDSRGHALKDVEEDGLLVRLEDESRWAVYEGFASRSKNWSVGDMITVKPNSDKEYPYLLVNVNQNDSVESQLLEDRQPESGSDSR